MKRLIATIIVVAAVGIGAWLTFSLRAKRKYDDARADLGKHLFSVVQMDGDTTALLAEVQTNWVESYSEVGSVYTEALKTVGLSPSVSNLIEMFTYRMPEYSLLFPSRNKEPAAMGQIQATLLPMSVDGLIYVSEDQHLAMIRCKTNVVLVFADEAGGLREAQYCVKEENVEPGAEGDVVDRAP